MYFISILQLSILTKQIKMQKERVCLYAYVNTATVHGTTQTHTTKSHQLTWVQAYGHVLCLLKCEEIIHMFIVPYCLEKLVEPARRHDKNDGNEDDGRTRAIRVAA